MPTFNANNPYGDPGQLGGNYAFGNGGPTNILGIPVAQGEASSGYLASQYGLPQISGGYDVGTLNGLAADSQAEAPFISQEQQLANYFQNLNPNNSVGAQLWQNQQLGDQMAQQAIGAQQNAYNLAKSYASGAATPAQIQMQQQQQASNALAAGATQSAGGGARGAAAAQGAVQDQSGNTAAMQQAARAQQKAQDQQQYAAEAAKLGNNLYGSQLGYQQGNASFQNAQGQLKGQYQQLGDQASLGAGSMLENILSQNYGLGQGTAQNFLNQYEQNANTQQQLFGAGVNAVGSGLSQLGRGGGGDGGAGGDNSPYGLGNNAENPWWNG